MNDASTDPEPTQSVAPGADPDADHQSDPTVVSPSEAMKAEFEPDSDHGTDPDAEPDR